MYLKKKIEEKLFWQICNLEQNLSKIIWLKYSINAIYDYSRPVLWSPLRTEWRHIANLNIVFLRIRTTLKGRIFRIVYTFSKIQCEKQICSTIFYKTWKNIHSPSILNHVINIWNLKLKRTILLMNSPTFTKNVTRKRNKTKIKLSKLPSVCLSALLAYNVCIFDVLLMCLSKRT